MNEEEIIEVAREAIMLTIELSTPTLMVGLVVGVSIALVQALTQIQEITLVFVPKILAIFIALFIFLPGMATALIAFMETLADRMIAIQ
ncbi:flagellar biosynthesis protein FliQ [Micavibrio aeruginosavorus]|uniref:Flagellar biosynthetic protein FliQ n=2 Tax=Micavibrio aeruginosavorus TaxID=349221 RepID=G2KRQ3_MICAA|nr:flagellar biosynthesis protein FliQ [Micavibrio aeruginosavorus]AEP10011.1 flagellar biosynthetic protein FliQ [Micavibrio aeruginosavorus ARL-13]AGH98424.1 Flagellar biosynthesis protein FliQ [Micavibrio aeruginosavorus EPB]